MRIFIYEFVTGGGMWSRGPEEPPSGSLLTEGGAMIRAVASDFLALPQTDIYALRDSRLTDFTLPGCRVCDVHSAEEESAAIHRLCRAADWSLVIAPEFDDLLLSRCRLVESAGGRLLSPGSNLIAVAADKHETAQRLAEHHVPLPRGRLLRHGEPLPEDFPFPAVLKPRYGAGSQGVQLLRSPDQTNWDACNESFYRLEQYCPGTASSVAVLCGMDRILPLPACTQQLSQDGRFRYLGGEVPLAAELNTRAQRLAVGALAALPSTTGYVGVDLVLGDQLDGGQDRVIEVNPRLTTSYVGLRIVSRTNLALAMLQMAQGLDVELLFCDKRVEFTCSIAIV